MSAIQAIDPVHATVFVLRWTARVASVAAIALLAQFAFGGGEPGTHTPSEAVALAFFPGGVVLGMLLGWWREGLGGLVTVLSLGAFYLWMIAQGGHVRGPYFLLFSSPGLLFLACALLNRARAGTLPPAP